MLCNIFLHWCPVKIGLHYITYIYNPFIQNQLKKHCPPVQERSEVLVGSIYNEII